MSSPTQLSQPSGSLPDSAFSILDAAALERTLERMAREVLERHPDLSKVCLIGIPSRGVELALRLGAVLKRATGAQPFCGSIDISMHRDDIGARRVVSAMQPTRLPANIEDGILILVDDVLQSGRTCRAAMDALSSFGRPARIEYAVLIDRGMRELPIAADYVGKAVAAAREERVFVRMCPPDLAEGVWLETVGHSKPLEAAVRVTHGLMR